MITGNELSDANVKLINTDVGILISNIGSFTSIVALMQWLYDTFVRKRIFEEIIETLVSSRAIIDSGVVEAYADSTKIEYEELIRTSHRLDLLVAH